MRRLVLCLMVLVAVGALIAPGVTAKASSGSPVGQSDGPQFTQDHWKICVTVDPPSLPYSDQYCLVHKG